MTSVNRTQGPAGGPIWPNGGKQVKTGGAGEVKSTGFVQITGNNTVDRAALDGISPYAAMGVNLSVPITKDISARTQREAEAMFPQFTGYYSLSNPQEANYELADINFRLQTRTAEDADRYVNAHTNRPIVEKHLSDGGYTNFLSELDNAIG